MMKIQNCEYLTIYFYRQKLLTGGVPDKNTPNKNPKRADWLVFLSQINWGVRPIRTRPIRTFVPD